MITDSLPRLNNDLLAASTIDSANDDKVIRGLGLGIVHLGIGAFHRAHQARYTQNAMLASGGDWRITGVSLRSETVARQLNPQDGLYTLIEQDADSISSQVISAIDSVLVAPQNPSVVLARLCDQSTRIVSLTITEKGYCHDPASGDLNFSHPDILYDLSHLDSPRSAIGFLVSAMQRRISQNLPAFTVMSCDNLPENGNLLHGLVLSFAAKVSPVLAASIDHQYRFPCSMIDRIVPAVTTDVISYNAKKQGYADHAVVATERFSQWVIEDNFACGRPDWAAAGALLVNDVHRFETMKLRLLNGSHSAIAYLGYLSGLNTVAEVIQIEAFQTFIRDLMHSEVMPSLAQPQGIDLNAYSEQLIQRFLNPNLHHQTYQIAMDGSQKLPQRLLNPLHFQRQHQGPMDRICLTIAAWIQYSSGVSLQGEKIVVQDPLSERLQQVAQPYVNQSSPDVYAWVTAIFKLEAIFDSTLASEQSIHARVSHWLTLLREHQNPAMLAAQINAGGAI